MSLSLRVLFALALVGLLTPASAAGADLSVVLDDGSGRVNVGSRLQYSLTVSNAGPDTATGVNVSLALPAQVVLLDVSSTHGPCVRSRTTTCEIGTLEPAGAAAVEVIVRPSAPGRLSAVAVAGASAPDANPANDSVALVTVVRLWPGPCVNVRRGTPSRDVLRGTTAGDAIFGRAGDDAIQGGGREDCLSGASGDDTLSGGGGHDTLFGDAGADVLSGGSGEDLAKGGSGPDRIAGAEEVEAGPGDDAIVAPPGAVVRCGSGDDFVRSPGRLRTVACERTRVPPPIPLTGPAPAPAPRRPGGRRRRGGNFNGGAPRDGQPRKRCRRRKCGRGGVIVRLPTRVSARPQGAL